MGALPKEEGGSVREYKATHEGNFLSSWLRDTTEGKEKESEEMRRKTEEETKCRNREVGGQMGRVVVVCEHAGFVFRSCLGGNLFREACK